MTGGFLNVRHDWSPWQSSVSRQPACWLGRMSQLWSVLRVLSGKQVEQGGVPWVSFRIQVSIRDSLFYHWNVAQGKSIPSYRASLFVCLCVCLFLSSFLSESLACIIPGLIVFVGRCGRIHWWCHIILHWKSPDPLIPKGYDRSKERFQDEKQSFSKKKKKKNRKEKKRKDQNEEPRRLSGLIPSVF